MTNFQTESESICILRRIKHDLINVILTYLNTTMHMDLDNDNPHINGLTMKLIAMLASEVTK